MKISLIKLTFFSRYNILFYDWSEQILEGDKINFREINNIFNTLNEGIIVNRPDTSIKFFNKSALDILKISEEELLNRTAYNTKWFLLDENNKKLELQQFPVIEVLNSKTAIKNRIIGISTNEDKIEEENIIWIQLNSIPLFDKNEKITYIVISFVDITTQQNALKSTYRKMYFNDITNLPNALFLKKQNFELDKSTLVLVQIDDFNKYRQYFGEDIMDEILIFVANKLSNYILKDSLYHIELDKFILILDSKKDIDYIEKMLQNLNKDELYFEKLELNLQITAGISFSSIDAINKVQIALSSAKKTDSLFEVYSANHSMFAELNDELFWSSALRKIIDNDDLVLAFQPIVDNTSLEVYKYEVLMRLKHNNEIYFPNSFLNISKQFKLYKYLTTSLIQKVFQFFSDKNIGFSINLNTEDLMNKDIHNVLFKNIQEFANPANVTIEIVESEGINNFKEVNRFLNRLKVYGCKVAIDDFGSGYSNFEYILKLDADYIKIDGSLIKNIDQNKNSQDIVKTIVSFAKLKGITTIAEFVSSKEIYDKVVELGIDYSQGFYFGKPEFDLSQTSYKIEEKTSTKIKEYKQLIYVSKLDCNLAINNLAGIFEKAAKKNKARDITGFIVYNEKYFLQIIEGNKDTINNLYEKIIQDVRHTDILLLGTKDLENRDFEEWNLGYVDSDKVIKEFLYLKTKKRLFLPYQFTYEFALDFLKGLNKIF